MNTGVDPDRFRSTLGRFASGVTVVTARDARGSDRGMTVSAFCSVSLAPPLVLVCIGRDAALYPLLDDVTHLGVSVLAHDQEGLSRHFADAEQEHGFDGIGFTRGESGVALLDDALAHLEGRIVARHDGGDHRIVVLHVERSVARDAQPLLYYRGGYAALEH